MMKNRLTLAARVKIAGQILGSIIFLLMAALFILIWPDDNKRIWISLFLAAVFVITGTAIFIYLFIVKPYRQTVKLLQDFNKGTVMEELFQMKYPFSGEFSWSLEKLHQLLDTKETLKLSVEQSRYLALQNQINPHFLYNALDSIRGDALMAGIHEVAKTTEALSTFFGYSISNLDKYAVLSEELENVKDYMTIQQYRFGDSLHMKIVNKDNDEEVYNYCLPRMTLQPLVENAIYHGLEEQSDLGTVTIAMCSTQSGLIITVTDNGVGMDHSIMERLNAAMHRAESGHTGANQERGGIAMKNVNSRIKLLFGEQYGLHIFSEKGAGTEIRISLPVVKKDALNR